MKKGDLMRLNKSVQKKKDRVLAVLSEGKELTGAEICELLSIGAGALYTILSRMEITGILESRWEDGPRPRRRLYRAKNIVGASGGI